MELIPPDSALSVDGSLAAGDRRDPVECHHNNLMNKLEGKMDVFQPSILRTTAPRRNSRCQRHPQTQEPRRHFPPHYGEREGRPV
jgi:hypothetical protein